MTVNSMRAALAAGVLGLAWLAPAAARDADAPPVELSFADFFSRPIGSRGLALGEPIRKADGRRVRIVGYMVSREDAQPGRFQLAPRPVRMSEHADGDADDLPPATMTVLLHPSQAGRIVEHRAGPIELTGLLHVGRAEDATGRVSWFRLELDPQALLAVAPSQNP
jgi:hypothetical protein